ncbi:hypothetical protein FQN54_001608 [Arachnomyces sp. PD_36]|nr:hypothetical protein FQN54_001608 [Arachnomyces sp. PD_36]
MRKFSKPTAFKNRRNRAANVPTNPPPPGRCCSAPSPSPGLATHLSTPADASTESQQDPAPPGPPPSSSQVIQPPAPPTRRLPLLTNRPPPKPRHTTFKQVKIHTAKCDICNIHNKAILNRCVDCGWQICSPCLADRAGDGTHTGGGAWTSAPRFNVAPSQATPPNAQGTASETPTNNASANATRSRDNTPSTPGVPSLILYGSSSNAQANPIAAHPTARINPSAGDPPTGTPLRRTLGSGTMITPVSMEKLKGKGKEKEVTFEDVSKAEATAGPSLMEDNDADNKRTLRPKRVVNYYNDSLYDISCPSDTEMDITATDNQDSDVSDGEDIPYEIQKPIPGPSSGVYAQYHPVQSETQTAKQPLRAKPSPPKDLDAEMKRDTESLLSAAAEALVDLKVERTGDGGKPGPSDSAATSFSYRAPLAPAIPNEQQAYAHLAPIQSTSSIKRKRVESFCTPRPAKIQGFTPTNAPQTYHIHSVSGSSSSPTRLEMAKSKPVVKGKGKHIATPIRRETSQAHTEVDNTNAQASTGYSAIATPSGNRSKKPRIEGDENQTHTLQTMPKKGTTNTKADSPQKVEVSPQLRNLYRSALQVKDRNGALRKFTQQGPQNE